MAAPVAPTWGTARASGPIDNLDLQLSCKVMEFLRGDSLIFGLSSHESYRGLRFLVRQWSRNYLVMECNVWLGDAVMGRMKCNTYRANNPRYKDVRDNGSQLFAIVILAIIKSTSTYSSSRFLIELADARRR